MPTDPLYPHQQLARAGFRLTRPAFAVLLLIDPWGLQWAAGSVATSAAARARRRPSSRSS